MSLDSLTQPANPTGFYFEVRMSGQFSPRLQCGVVLDDFVAPPTVTPVLTRCHVWWLVPRQRCPPLQLRNCFVEGLKVPFLRLGVSFVLNDEHGLCRPKAVRLSFNSSQPVLQRQDTRLRASIVQFVKDSCLMSVQVMSKTVVSVAEMARIVGLSRARFYQLVKEGIFPAPVYDVMTRRPFFTEEMQAICMEVRKRNCGVNGKPILFYSPRHPLGHQPRPVKKPKVEPKTKSQYGDLLDGLRALGLESITAAQVEPVVKELFPDGIQKLDCGEVIRAVFLWLKRRDS